MSVCGHRPSENAGMFTPCATVGGCVCRDEVKAELEAETQEDE